MKTRLLTLIFSLFSIITLGQVKLTTDNKFQIGYEVYTPILIGNYYSQGVNYGTWGIEHWDGGLNIWKPWPCPNSGNYKFFIDDATGNVGIGRKPTAGKLDISGDVAINGIIKVSSDVRLKTNINSLTDCLNKINKLNGKSYNKIITPQEETNLNEIHDSLKYKTTLNSNTNKRNKPQKTEFGFIAQELLDVFPELVQKDTAGYYYIDYIGLIPVIIEALKEQKSIIDNQNEKIKSLERLLENKSKVPSKNINTDISKVETSPILDQNVPNPFNQATIIKYYLPESSIKATIYIYNMNGEQIKSIPLNQKEEGNITINGYELRPGMYLYSLVVDNQFVDTKRMILTQ